MHWAGERNVDELFAGDGVAAEVTEASGLRRLESRIDSEGRASTVRSLRSTAGASLLRRWDSIPE